MGEFAYKHYSTLNLCINQNFRHQQKTDERLQELLGEEDFPGAIQLILECQKVIYLVEASVLISKDN